MTDTPKVSNVLAVYNLATANNLREGLAWYPTAHNLAHTLAGGNRGRFGYRRNVERAAGIIAALSPMNSWENNKRKAIAFYAAGGVVEWDGPANGLGLGKNVAKAERIYAGEHPRDVLGGNKVRAFYATILEPTGDHRAVIDRHAFDIAVGERTDDKRRGALGRKGVYDAFSDVYREAAIIAGVTTAQMQAITWVAWREINGIV